MISNDIVNQRPRLIEMVGEVELIHWTGNDLESKGVDGPTWSHQARFHLIISNRF